VGTRVTSYVGPLMTVTGNVVAGCVSGVCAMDPTTISVDVHLMAGGRRVASVRSALGVILRTLYLHRDRLGSVIATTVGGTSTGATYRYGPYGAVTSASGDTGDSASELGYSGALRLSRGLLRMGARVYNPQLRVFIQPDPLDPQAYTYAGGDPINNVDPSGLAPTNVEGTRSSNGRAWGQSFGNHSIGVDFFGSRWAAANRNLRNWSRTTGGRRVNPLSHIGSVPHMMATNTGDSTSCVDDENRTCSDGGDGSAPSGPPPDAPAQGGDAPGGAAPGTPAPGAPPAAPPAVVGPAISTEPAGISSGVQMDFVTAPGVGSANGVNWQADWSGGSGLYTFTGECVGLVLGGSLQSVWAYGSGPWTGTFQSVSVSYGPFSASVFWTPGPGGWTGVTFGLGRGIPGVGICETDYVQK
jgi:RHS repeat-associated protein